jgi:putative membrane protein
MKKQIISFVMLVAAVAMVSCNNDGDSNTDGTTTSTATDSGTGSGMGGTDTSTTGMGTTGTTATAANLSETDRTFVMEAASGGMMEVELGRMASQTANHERVKNFGNMMVQDHTNANNELRAIASTKNITLPDSMMAKHRKHIDMLKTKTGREFDRAYMSMMVTDHNEDVSKFQTTSNNAADADLKGFASKTLPKLRMHLDSAKAINTAVKK